MVVKQQPTAVKALDGDVRIPRVHNGHTSSPDEHDCDDDAQQPCSTSTTAMLRATADDAHQVPEHTSLMTRVQRQGRRLTHLAWFTPPPVRVSPYTKRALLCAVCSSALNATVIGLVVLLIVQQHLSSTDWRTLLTACIVCAVHAAFVALDLGTIVLVLR